MKKISLRNVVWKEYGAYVSWNLNTGISSFGDTRKDALSALDEALDLYFEDEKIPSSYMKIERPDIVSAQFSYA